MIKRIREEKGGFTLAELLIVVAIILVLVAVAVPVFTGAMDNAIRLLGERRVMRLSPKQLRNICLITTLLPKPRQ